MYSRFPTRQQSFGKVALTVTSRKLMITSTIISNGTPTFVPKGALLLVSVHQSTKNDLLICKSVRDAAVPETDPGGHHHLAPLAGRLHGDGVPTAPHTQAGRYVKSSEASRGGPPIYSGDTSTIKSPRGVFFGTVREELPKGKIQRGSEAYSYPYGLESAGRPSSPAG